MEARYIIIREKRDSVDPREECLKEEGVHPGIRVVSCGGVVPGVRGVILRCSCPPRPDEDE